LRFHKTQGISTIVAGERSGFQGLCSMALVFLKKKKVTRKFRYTKVSLYLTFLKYSLDKFKKGISQNATEDKKDKNLLGVK
jgi:hypothetical protein